MPHGDKKVLTIERLEHDRSDKGCLQLASQTEYRLGYHTVFHKGAAHNQWRWAQFAPMMPVSLLPKLLKRAIYDRTITNLKVGGGRSVLGGERALANTRGGRTG